MAATRMGGVPTGIFGVSRVQLPPKLEWCSALQSSFQVPQEILFFTDVGQ